MTRHIFSGMIILTFLFVLPGEAAEKPGGKFTIQPDRNSYRVGEMIKLKVTFDNVKNPFVKGAGQGSFVSFPEMTVKGGDAVKRVPLFRMKMLRTQSPEIAREAFMRGWGEIIVMWRIEKKVWRDEETGEVIYDGVGIEAGATPMGAYLYMLEKVPGKYDISLNWVINPWIDRSDYNIDPDRADSRISNTISIEILPEKR